MLASDGQIQITIRIKLYRWITCVDLIWLLQHLL